MNYQDPSVLPPGTRVDDYVILSVLGQGGFGITYQVRDEALGRDYALKEFFPQDLVVRQGPTVAFNGRPNSESDYRWSLRKFNDEARLLAQLSHPNIVNVRRVFQANNSAYMLLDFVKGSTFESWLRSLDSPPTQEELDIVSTHLLGALELVHANRICHLDISPDNIMIRASDGLPVLLDFGASRFEIKQHSQLVSALVVRHGYSPPEQYSSTAVQYGAWTDIYAVASTLYRAVTGSAPPESTQRVVKDTLKPAADVGKGMYRDKFLRAIDGALQLQLERRPQSIAAWRKRLLDSQTQTHLPAPSRLVPIPASGLRQSAAASGRPARGVGAALWIIATIVILAPLITAAGALLMTSRSSSDGEVWETIKDTKEVATLEAFIARYKEGFYVDLARKRLAQVKLERDPNARPNTLAPCDGIIVALGARNERRCMKPGAGKLESFSDCRGCPEMVVVPAGEFVMGSPPQEDQRKDNETQHKVRFSKPFSVGRFAVTVGEFSAFAREKGHTTARNCQTIENEKWVERGTLSYENPGFAQDDRHPVVCVNFDDASAFVAWLSNKAGKPYRLLSEAEREYVARAGTTTPFWWGVSINTFQANYQSNLTYGGGSTGEWRKRTVPVDSFGPNPWGLYNVHGNAWDWLEDCWHENYGGAPSDGSPWTTGDCTRRSVRGGSWNSAPWNIRVAFRNRNQPAYRHDTIGFRVARTLE